MNSFVEGFGLLEQVVKYVSDYHNPHSYWLYFTLEINAIWLIGKKLHATLMCTHQLATFANDKQ